MTRRALALPNMPSARRSFLAWLWVLLAAIGAHAMLPVGSPVVPTSGSAFSASTIEVALQPRRWTVMAEAATERARPDDVSVALPAILVTAGQIVPSAFAPAALPPAPDVPDGGRLAASTFPARGPPIV